jgi:uncharacterized protein YdeI (YjbR/CyaY-like superfamily)
MPAELQARLDAAPTLRAAFEALTRCAAIILAGRGFNERP